MSDDPFGSLIAWQEQLLAFQRRQLDLACDALRAGEAMLAAQKAGRQAAESGAAAWQAWIKLWTPER